MEIKIRLIEPRDDAKIEGIIRSCLKEFGADHEGTAWADPFLGKLSQVYKGNGERYWVAEDENGRLLGGTGIGRLPGETDICELQKTYCIPEARGTGAGNRLIGTALEYAGKHYKKCYLETLDEMKRAQRFYEKHGFHRTDERIGDTGHYACDIKYIKDLHGRPQDKES